MYSLSPKPLRPPAGFDHDEIVIHIVPKPLGYIRAYDIKSPIYMYYMFSKISLVFAIWGVSKDTVFALSSVLLNQKIVCVFVFANLATDM